MRALNRQGGTDVVTWSSVCLLFPSSVQPHGGLEEGCLGFCGAGNQRSKIKPLDDHPEAAGAWGAETSVASSVAGEVVGAGGLG